MNKENYTLNIQVTEQQLRFLAHITGYLSFSKIMEILTKTIPAVMPSYEYLKDEYLNEGNFNDATAVYTKINQACKDCGIDHSKPREQPLKIGNYEVIFAPDNSSITVGCTKISREEVEAVYKRIHATDNRPFVLKIKESNNYYYPVGMGTGPDKSQARVFTSKEEQEKEFKEHYPSMKLSDSDIIYV